MKKERNEIVLLIMELLIYAFKLLLAVAGLFATVYIVGSIVEALSGFITLGAGLLMIFTLSGLLLFIDFRGGDDSSDGAWQTEEESPSECVSSRKALRAYSER